MDYLAPYIAMLRELDPKKSYTTFVICLTVFFLFADQNLLAPNLSAVADDFHMDEDEKDRKLGGMNDTPIHPYTPLYTPIHPYIPYIPAIAVYTLSILNTHYTHLGYISFGFFIVGGPAAILIGYLTDTVQRS